MLAGRAEYPFWLGSDWQRHKGVEGRHGLALRLRPGLAASACESVASSATLGIWDMHLMVSFVTIP